MGKKQEGELGEFVEEMAESLIDMEDGKKDEKKAGSDYKGRIYLIILVTVAVAAVAVAGVTYLGKRTTPREQDQSSLRIQQLEEKMARLQAIEGRVGALEKEGKQLKQSVIDVEKQSAFLKQQLEKAAEESKAQIAELRKEMTAVSSQVASQVQTALQKSRPDLPATQPVPDNKKNATSKTRLPSSPSETAETPLYHKVARGENLFRIAQKYGVSVEDLCTLNNISNPSSVTAGTKLKIRP